MLLYQAFQLFKMDRESYCSEKTLIYYEENVSKFLNFLSQQFQCDVNLIDSSVVSREVVLLYISMLRASGVKNTTVNTYFRATKAFLNYCMEEGFVQDNVLRKVKFLKSDQEPIIPLTCHEVDDIDGLFSTKCESGLRNLCIIHLMLDAGFRCSDVCNLKISNINFKNNYLVVQGKGAKYRSVPLCSSLKKMLYQYLIYYRSYMHVDDFQDAPVFVSVDGKSSFLSNDAIKQLFVRIKRNTGIERVHPHMLRHTFATSYIVGGGNLEFLRMMLGHSDYETTKLYLHLAEQSKMLRSDIYKLDSIFFKSGY